MYKRNCCDAWPSIPSLFLSFVFLTATAIEGQPVVQQGTEQRQLMLISPLGHAPQECAIAVCALQAGLQ